MLAISTNPYFIAQFPFQSLSPPSFNFSFEIRLRICYIAYAGQCTAKFENVFLAGISSMHPVLSVGQQEGSRKAALFRHQTQLF